MFIIFVFCLQQSSTYDADTTQEELNDIQIRPACNRSSRVGLNAISVQMGDIKSNSASPTVTTALLSASPSATTSEGGSMQKSPTTTPSENPSVVRISTL